MRHQAIGQVKSITSVVGNWYRVLGTRDEPELERVTVWAVIELVSIDEDTGERDDWRHDVIVGVPSSHFAVQGNDVDDWLVGVAGYVELSDEQYEKVLENPLRLQHELLIWAD